MQKDWEFQDSMGYVRDSMQNKQATFQWGTLGNR